MTIKFNYGHNFGNYYYQSTGDLWMFNSLFLKTLGRHLHYFKNFRGDLILYNFRFIKKLSFFLFFTDSHIYLGLGLHYKSNTCNALHVADLLEDSDMKLLDFLLSIKINNTPWSKGK